MASPIVGVLGGMGPRAGVDLTAKIISETIAERDQDHIPVVHFSMPEPIPNRTAFLMDTTSSNPALELARQLGMMASIGVQVAGMACNTAHAAPIFDRLMSRRAAEFAGLKLLHLIDETASFITNNYPDISRIGILATSGTYQFRLYEDRLEAAGLLTLHPDEPIKSTTLQSAINHPEWGIKAESDPVTDRAANSVNEGIADLAAQGAEAVVLGCTELPLAVKGRRGGGPVIIDPTRVLARALIEHAYPEKLKPLSPN